MSGPASESQAQIMDDSKKVIEGSDRNSYLAIVQKIKTVGLQPQGNGKMSGIRVREEDVTMDVLEPPTKRARVEQDPSPKISLSNEQKKHMEETLQALMKHPAAVPFLVPVDPVQANIPTYFDKIKQPMDLGTIQSKLKTTPPAYDTLQSFVDDVHLIFDNCYRFNGVGHSISLLAIQVQTEFQNRMRQLPGSESLIFQAIPEVFHIPAPPALPPKRPSNSTVAKKVMAPRVYVPATLSAHSRRDPLRIAQVKFCKTVLDHLYRKEYEAWVFPFLRPVDLSEFPNYLELIKNPMDLGTIHDKLSHAAYGIADEFHKDMKLMFNNCYTYNPDWAPVWGYAKELEKVFDSKWKQLPLEVETQEKDSKYASKKRQSEGSVSTQLKTNSSKPKAPRSAPLTENQKIDLCDALWELPDAKLDEVIELIRKRLPQYRNNVETVSLDFENIPPAVQCEIFDFLQLKTKAVQGSEGSMTPSDSDSDRNMDTSDGEAL